MDFHHQTAWSCHGDRWFHAASTIKVPVLLGVFARDRGGAVQDVLARPRAQPLPERGRRQALPRRRGRDANPTCTRRSGKTMQVSELAQHMIVTSSNLATNLLIDLSGSSTSRRRWTRFGLHGIELRRGVEDLTAWERGHQQPGHRGRAPRRAASDRGGPRTSPPDLRGEMLDILHGRSSGAASRRACPTTRGSRTRPARSRPSPTTPGSSSCPTASPTCW